MRQKFNRSSILSGLFMLLVTAFVLRGFVVRSAYAEEPAKTPSDYLDFTIAETSELRGIRSTHTVDVVPDGIRVGPWLQSLGTSVSVADVNGDGFMDIYVPSGHFGGQNQLYINDGHGHFTDQAESYGLANLNQSTITIRAVFFDINNDGRQDLLLVTNSCPVVYIQDADHKFNRVANSFPATSCQVNEAIALIDLNGDNRLDILMGGIPFDVRSLRVLPSNVVEANNGTQLSAMINLGDGRFAPSTDFLDKPGSYFYHSIGIGDLRGTGKPDLWIATDFNSDKLYLNHDNKFISTEAPYSNSKSGMNSEVMYLRDDPTPYVFVTHVFHLGHGVGGNNLWQWDGEKFKDHSVERGLHECGWSWGGRAVDLNNDGLLDLAVANGFISGDPKQDYWFSFGVLISSAEDILRTFYYWPEMKGKDFSGHERDCLYVNRGDHFENVASAVNFDSDKLDGRGVAVIDPDNSGRQHLVVANQKGKLKYYDIQPKRPNSWVGFSVASLTGVREAIGTKITVYAGGHTYRREAYTLNTFAAQSDPRLHFGLGSIAKIDDVEVRWPDGKIQHLGPVGLNSYHTLVQE